MVSGIGKSIFFLFSCCNFNLYTTGIDFKRKRGGEENKLCELVDVLISVQVADRQPVR